MREIQCTITCSILLRRREMKTRNSSFEGDQGIGSVPLNMDFSLICIQIYIPLTAFKRGSYESCFYWL